MQIYHRIVKLQKNEREKVWTTCRHSVQRKQLFFLKLLRDKAYLWVMFAEKKIYTGYITSIWVLHKIVPVVLHSKFGGCRTKLFI